MYLMIKRALTALTALTLGLLSLPATANAVAINAGTQVRTTTINRNNFGINVFSYDSQLNAPSTESGLQTLGMGMQQFPNANEWSWTTNSFRSGGQAPVSLLDWGHILEKTHNQGLFIFNYDENPTFTGGGTPADATQLTQYIVSHHLPITSIVIGSEEYGAWDHYANLNPSFSASYYATQAARIAKAIHAVDPNMKVGVSFSLTQGPHSLSWDQAVLRTAGPFINFVSIHDYPNAHPLTNTALLASLPRDISQAMRFVKSEITANVGPSYAPNIQTWVTEYNPYGEPGIQSVQPVYGAAMVESALLWRADGADKLFIWSYDGQAHVANPKWPVATTNQNPFGLFALAGDGQTPELPINALYPSGHALASLMAAIGSGGTLRVQTTSNSVIGQVHTNAGTHVFAINFKDTPQILGDSPHTLSVSGTSMKESSHKLITSSATISNQDTSVGWTSYQAQSPTFNPTMRGYPGETVTLTGTGFGRVGKDAHVIISQNGINYGGPGDAYRVTIKHWSSNTISFVVPNGASGPALKPGVASLLVETAHRLVSHKAALTVTPTPTLVAHISQTLVSPGTSITFTGTQFGAMQGAGYVLIAQDGVNYGGPSDWYGVTITGWTNHTVRFKIPEAGMSATGHGEPSLQPGPATVTLVSSAGVKSPPVQLTVK